MTAARCAATCLEMIATNVRHPRDFRGDLAAMIGSAHVGERRLLALAAEFGWPMTDAAIEAVLDGAERQTRAVIARVDRTASTTARPCSTTTAAATRTSISAPRSKSAAATSTIDLSDSHAGGHELRQFVLPEHALGGGRGAVLSDRPDTPKNDGTFRPITVIAKPGTVVWANPGMPVTLATNHCGQEIIEAIVKALAPACPDRAMAGWGRRFRIAIQGRDPRAECPGPEASPLSGISSRRGRAAAPRRPATAGPAPANGRRRAASSSAASK